MTKKTRKEKIIAGQRKKKKLTISVSEDTYNAPLKTVIEKSADPYFISDLRKSLIIIAGIITLEIVIYFVRIK